MTTKQWLNRGHDLDAEINALLFAQYQIRLSLMRITQAYSGDVRVQTSKVLSDRTEAALDRIGALENQVNDRIDALTAVKAEILDAIERVSQPTLRTLLIERYVNFKPWVQIAKVLTYDVDHVRKYLHNEALREISRIIFP